jgi:tight adherence protein B
MIGILVPFGVLLVAIIGLIAFWYQAAQRDLVARRMEESDSETDYDSDLEKPFATRWSWIPWMIIVPIGVLVAWYWQWPWNIAIGAIFVLSLIGMEIDAWIYQWRVSRIESQLADAIDVLVASVGAGSSLQASLSQASENTPMPLRGELTEMVARLRLGDSPPDVFDLLRQRVPSETFRLFSTTLTVNWQVGGALAETLAAIGSTIRDRLAIARQLRTLSTQGALTTVTVLAVVWFMAAMMWQADPPRFTSFLFSVVGSWLTAASLFLQGVGVALVSRISRPKI